MLSSASLRTAPLRRFITQHATRALTTTPKPRLITAPQRIPSKLTVSRSASFATSAEAEAGAETNQNFAAVATGGIPYPGIPKIEDPYQKRQWQLEHMAGAFRVFARMGFTEGAAGHISVRDPVDPATFWINP